MFKSVMSFWDLLGNVAGSVEGVQQQVVSGRLFFVPYIPHLWIRTILTLSAKGIESFVPLPLQGGLRTMTNVIFMLQWLKINCTMGEEREQLICRFFILRFYYAFSSQNENPIFFVVQLLEHSKIFKYKLT